MKTVFIERTASKRSLKLRKPVFGVGVNDAEYNLRYTIGGIRVSCPFYLRWVAMLSRCYSEALKSRVKTYDGCTVCSEWLLFSNFKKWMKAQDWQGKHIDKDLLVEGNRVYGPEACVFIDAITNLFIIKSANSVGPWMTGACWVAGRSKFISSCSNPFTKKRETLGYFDDQLDAHRAWKARKHEHSVKLSEKQVDPKAKEALLTRFLQRDES